MSFRSPTGLPSRPPTRPPFIALRHLDLPRRPPPMGRTEVLNINLFSCPGFGRAGADPGRDVGGLDPGCRDAGGLDPGCRDAGGLDVGGRNMGCRLDGWRISLARQKSTCFLKVSTRATCTV